MKRIFTHPKQFLCIVLFTAVQSFNGYAQTNSSESVCSYKLTSCSAGISATFDEGNEDFIGSNGVIYNTNGYFSVANVESSKSNYTITSGAYLANTTTINAGVDYSGDGSDDVGAYTLNILDATTNVILASCTVLTNEDFITTSVGSLCQTISNESLAGKNVRFQLIFAADADASGTLILDNFRTNLPLGASTLPVEFTGFDANRTSNGVLLTWMVATEVNAKAYVVEKSTDGRNYSQIGHVSATNNSRYSFTDAQTSNNVVYYRIKNVDNDGKHKYSSVIRLENKTTGTLTTLRAYPSPANEQAVIEHKKLNSKATITITTVDGRTVRTIIPVIGSSSTPVNLSGIPRGVYIIRLDDGQHTAETSKLIKQ